MILGVTVGTVIGTGTGTGTDTVLFLFLFLFCFFASAMCLSISFAEKLRSIKCLRTRASSVELIPSPLNAFSTNSSIFLFFIILSKSLLIPISSTSCFN